MTARKSHNITDHSPDHYELKINGSPADDVVLNNRSVVGTTSQENRPNKIALIVVKLRHSALLSFENNAPLCKFVVKVVLFILYNIYLAFAIAYDWHRQTSYCDGVKLLVVITVIVYLCVIQSYFINPKLSRLREEINLDKLWKDKFSHPSTKWVVLGSIGVAIVGFVIMDSHGRPERLMSFVGILFFIFVGFIFSKHPDRINWRQVLAGLYVQFGFAFLIIRWPYGKMFFECLSEKIKYFLSFANEGSGFVFDYLVDGDLNKAMIKPQNATEVLPKLPLIAGVFAFKILCVIFFFSLCISVLYYLGAMQCAVRNVGSALQTIIGTTAAESMCAAANIFIGMIESPLLIGPYLNMLTMSELHSVMAGGFATIAGGVLAAYISFGVDASHLLAASVMSAPAALSYAKLLYPETEESKTTSDQIKMGKPEERNILEAAANGASMAVSMVGNIIANLIAFIAAVKFINFVIIWLFSRVGMDYVSFDYLISLVFTPMAYLMGVNWEDCQTVGRLVGLKTVINEFVGYVELGKVKAAGKISKRAEVIATYALCGFSNFGSVAIELGALGSIIPERKGDLAELAMRALVAGSVACFITACVAGVISELDY